MQASIVYNHVRKLDIRQLATDARRSPFAVNKAIENDYLQALKKIARASGNIIDVHVDGATIPDIDGMMKLLSNYEKVIKPWATRKAGQMITKTAQKNFKAWRSQMKSIGQAMRHDVNATKMGDVAQKLLHDQVDLITSIPREAGERAQKLAMEAATGGRRADEVAEELQRTTEVTESRATLIARTEVAKSNASINRARAESVGANQYTWRTMEDEAVRPEHDEIDGDVFSYDDPPDFDSGDSYNPGEFCNCRCYSEPIID